MANSPLILNLYGGPGLGKSTIAAGVFYLMKLEGLEVELVSEFAKDLTWEERAKTLQFQPYVIGKQMYKIWRVMDGNDLIIVDSPILLGHIYADKDTPSGFFTMLAQYQQKWNTLDVLLKRDPRHGYKEAGRNQTLEEAKVLDRRVERLLDTEVVPYHSVTVGANAVYEIAALLQGRLGLW